MVDEVNILGADGKAQPSDFATPDIAALEVKILDAGEHLVLSGPTAEAVQAALNSFIKRGSKVVSQVGLVGRRWVAACDTPTTSTGLDTTQTLNLSDVVKVLDANGMRMLSGPAASAVEHALNRYIEQGSTVISAVSQVGKNWVASCTIPPKDTGLDAGQKPTALDDGCRVENFGFKRIIYGPSQLIVQIRVEQMRKFGAHLVGDIEQEGEEWVAVCDIGGT